MSASTFGGFVQALIAAAKLNAGLTDAPRVATYRRALVASLERLQQAGCGPWVDEWIGVLADERCWLPIWEADGNDLIKLLGELLNMDEAAAETCPRDGDPAVLVGSAWPMADEVSHRCALRRHSACGGCQVSGASCLCACHASAAATPIRPASPPPPSNDGDELALEMAAGYAATGDTVPPLAEACGSDTEPPGPGSVEWWDEQSTVRS